MDKDAGGWIALQDVPGSPGPVGTRLHFKTFTSL